MVGATPGVAAVTPSADSMLPANVVEHPGTSTARILAQGPSFDPSALLPSEAFSELKEGLAKLQELFSGGRDGSGSADPVRASRELNRFTASLPGSDLGSKIPDVAGKLSELLGRDITGSQAARDAVRKARAELASANLPPEVKASVQGILDGVEGLAESSSKAFSAALLLAGASLAGGVLKFALFGARARAARGSSRSVWLSVR